MANMTDHIDDETRQALQTLAQTQREQQERTKRKDRTQMMEAIVNRARAKGYRAPDNRVRWKLDRADELLAQGLVLFMQQFCDPEEMEYPYLKKALDAHKIPFIKLGVDQQMRDFGQAETAIQAFADIIS